MRSKKMLSSRRLLWIAMACAPLWIVPAAHAQGSMLRVGCEDADSGAEVLINGQFKGECPVDIQVGTGTLKLRIVKKIDDLNERVFEQDIRMVDGTVKRVEARFGPPVLSAKGRLLEAKRQEEARQQEIKRLAEEKQREIKRLAEEKQQEVLRQEAEKQRQYEISLKAQRQQEENRLALAELKSQGFEPGNGKSFRDCDGCPEMVWIPPGSIKRPPVPGNLYREWSNQVHIDYPLAVGKFEITFDDWERCAAEGPCSKIYPFHEGLTPGMFFNTRWGQGRQPRINVSRTEVVDYLDWLKRKTGHEYRLLSMSEFTYAAYAGRHSHLPWGNEVGSNNANCFNCGSEKAGVSTMVVGSFPANDWGLHDMIGNVAEMMQDCYFVPTKASLPDLPRDGSPVLTNCKIYEPWRQFVGDKGYFIAMGGAWSSPIGAGIEISHWQEKIPALGIGFRVARTFKSMTPGASSQQ